MKDRFGSSEISLVNTIFGQAEKLAVTHFRLNSDSFRTNKYEVQTLARLNDKEINERAFAQLCRYYCQKDGNADHPDNFYFFRICLQDDRILDAVKRGGSFIKLTPLLLYIATHELVHVIRFNNGESDFDAPLEEKKNEEDKVHSITRTILKPLGKKDIDLVLECFSDRYHIGDIFAT